MLRDTLNELQVTKHRATLSSSFASKTKLASALSSILAPLLSIADSTPPEMKFKTTLSTTIQEYDLKIALLRTSWTSTKRIREQPMQMLLIFTKAYQIGFFGKAAVV